VGYAPLNWYGNHSALGTDGFPADMFDEAKFGYFRNVESEHRALFSQIPTLLNNGQKLASEFFGQTFWNTGKRECGRLGCPRLFPADTATEQNLFGPFSIRYEFNHGAPCDD